MPTYGQLVISSKIVSAILHLQRGDICTAENKVWLLFRDVNFGISSSKSVTGDILQRPTIVLFCFFSFIFTYRSQFQTYKRKDFTFPNKPFVFVFQTPLELLLPVWAHCWLLLSPLLTSTSRSLSAGLLFFFLLMSQYTWEINVLNNTVL